MKFSRPRKQENSHHVRTTGNFLGRRLLLLFCSVYGSAARLLFSNIIYMCNDGYEDDNNNTITARHPSTDIWWRSVGNINGEKDELVMVVERSDGRLVGRSVRLSANGWMNMDRQKNEEQQQEYI